ncbi:MAG: hypothetical protein ACLS2V_13065 [Clostridium paraputrificum]|uniref:hypothetical protein n=1 Tax=Clostridium sp. TaxID=1506 RepID=UPI0025C53719|nr:hypothetical protein [Clostridium sp.]MBS5928321.1 hypothetical protein [Clostridium sp.]
MLFSIISQGINSLIFLWASFLLLAWQRFSASCLAISILHPAASAIQSNNSGHKRPPRCQLISQIVVSASKSSFPSFSLYP